MIDLRGEIGNILRRDPSKMYSKEEILNLLAPIEKDKEIEALLAELEVESSVGEGRSNVYSTCRAGTVYYKWNST
jgi:hypothetical protein